MRQRRQIIEIDEDKCDGCGLCILACAEGALEIVEGKARLVGDIYCDGLGACIGDCPRDALHIIERDADEFDEAAVEQRLQDVTVTAETHAERDVASSLTACSCPGAASHQIKQHAPSTAASTSSVSELGHWPVKLYLLNPQAPFLTDADLVVMADCAGVSVPDLHARFLRDRAVAIGCPKFDDLNVYTTRLVDILRYAAPRSLTVVHMEVPCCGGIVTLVERALAVSGANIPLRRVMVSRAGEIMEDEVLTEVRTT